MRSSATNKQQYQVDRSNLKMSPQMSNSRHQISNLKLENINSQQNTNCPTLNQWKSHSGPMVAPIQVSQYITQQIQNQLKSNQNHLICTCPPEVHKALLEQQLLQHQTHHQHQHVPAQHLQHFQPCPHQRQNMKSIVSNAGIEPQSIYALINQQQSYPQPQIKTTSSTFSIDPISATTPQPSNNQLSMSQPSTSLQHALWYSRQSSNPETIVEARAQISKMESQLMYLTSWIQNNIHINNNNPANGNYVGNEPNYVPQVLDSSNLSQHSNCLPCYIVTSDRMAVDGRDGHSNVEATPSNSSLDSAYSAKSTTSSDNNSSIPKQQYAIPGNSQIYLPTEMKLPTEVFNKLSESKFHLQAMKQDINALKKWNQSFRLSLKDDINETFLKIKKLIENSSGMNNIPIQKERQKVNDNIASFTLDVEFQIDKLEDLEVAIEDLRMNVLTRRCRVNIEEVEVLALHLSKISKCLATNKAEFPALEMNLKQIMQTEIDIMKTDERFLETEPSRLENALRLCKKLISTLFTLKRLGSVQENTGSDGIPEIRSNRDPKQKDKQAIFEHIKMISPDHSYRMQQIAQAEKLRECRKRMLTSHESLKFEKSLELAAKALKDVKMSPSSNSVHQIIKEENIKKIYIINNTKECDSLSSLTDSDLEITSKPDIQVIRKEPSNKFISGYVHRLPLINDMSHTSSSDTSNDQDSSDNASSNRQRSIGNANWITSRLSSKQGTILKTSQHSSRSNRSSKVAFNRTVTVEGGSEVLQLNCPEDDYDEDLSSMTFTSPPPPPPPRLSSQDETVSPPEAEILEDNVAKGSIWHQQYNNCFNNQVSKTEP